MNEKQYIAIENELTSFRKNEQKRIKGKELKIYFSKLKNQTHYTSKKEITTTQLSQIEKKVLRTETGNAYYIDGDVIEVVTPPIEINYGFATRLTNSLMIARENILKTIPLEHTGYSIHWNLTTPYSSKEKNSENRKKFMRPLIVPFQMFGLTPVSIGCAIRERYPRWELMSDDIPTEKQLSATALLLGAYLKNQKNKSLMNYPTEIEIRKSKKDNRLVYSNNYTNRVKVISTIEGKQTTQEFLLSFYERIHKEIEKLGDKKEIENLENFILGKENLEIDHNDFWIKTRNNQPNNLGINLPLKIKNKTNIFRKNKIKKQTPLEGKCYGVIISKKNIQKFSWNKLVIKNEDGTLSKIEGVENIINYGSRLLNN